MCGGRGVGDLFIHPCGYAVGGGSTTNVEGPLEARRPCGALPVVMVGGGGWRQVGVGGCMWVAGGGRWLRVVVGGGACWKEVVGCL